MRGEVVVPGAHVTVKTEPCATNMDIYAHVLVTKPDGEAESAHGVASLYVDGVVVDTKFWYATDDEYNTGIPAVLKFMRLNMPAGSHTVHVTVKALSGSAIVNYTAPVSLPYFLVTPETNAMKTLLQVNTYRAA
jgi:hypothetical protein